MSLRHWGCFTLGILLSHSLGAVDQVSQSSGELALPSRAVSLATIPHETKIDARPKLVGIYGPDGIFRRTSGHIQRTAQGYAEKRFKPGELPDAVDLHPMESVLEDYEPPAHATKVAKSRSLFTILFNDAATLAYGHAPVLAAPTHITTDSRERLVIADPDLPAVHVLDIHGKNSFRISGGAQHRMQMPNGVAVDAADNIYVADGKKGVVLVYDAQGRFLHYLGNFRGESMFQAPAGIAVDRDAGNVYVLDAPVNELVVLDLKGRVAKRIGGWRTAGKIEFDDPTEIALRNEKLVILDQHGSRIQVFDLDCNLVRAFRIRSVSGAPSDAEMGLSLDSRSNIYVSNLNGSAIRIYDHDGTLIGTWDLNAARGLWIDLQDRLYLADTYNSCVQVFLASPHASIESNSNVDRSTR